jgi:hypothetical protein
MIAWIKNKVSALRFPWLLGVTLVLLAVDVAIPDVVPFADEILLAGMAAMLSRLKKTRTKKGPDEPPGPFDGNGS